MNTDFSELIAEFCAHHVDFLVVGAHALAAHGHVRATKDLDVWVRPTIANGSRVLSALRAFGAPLHDLTAEDLATPGVVFQIGVAPIQIDILTAVDGLNFDVAWSGRVGSEFGGQQVFVLSREHLIANKRASGRLQDLADVERLMSDRGE